MDKSNNTENPGLIAGHAQYVKGAAEVGLPYFLALPKYPYPPIRVHFKEQSY